MDCCVLLFSRLSQTYTSIRSKILIQSPLSCSCFFGGIGGGEMPFSSSRGDNLGGGFSSTKLWLTFDGDFSPETFDRFVMVGEVVFDVIDVDSMVVKEENVLNRLLRLLENDMEPYELLGGKGGAETSSELPMLGT